jgi:DNA ligase (NAD+)
MKKKEAKERNLKMVEHVKLEDMTEEDFIAYNIKYHNEKYFNGEAEITDAEFDSLVKELKEINPDHPVLSEVGSMPTWGKKVTHSSIMGSLNKITYDKSGKLSEVINWVRKYCKKSIITITPKIDGLAASLKYKNGELKIASTRGDGTTGQNITDNVKYIKSIPQKIDYKGDVEIRGEFYIQKDEFVKYREEMIDSGEKIPANPRNLASGTIQQKDPKKTGNIPLEFFAYDVIRFSDFKSEMEKQEFILTEISNFIYVDPIECRTIEDVLFEVEHWEDMRNDLNYEIDGLVLSANQIDVQEEAGWTGKCPNGKVAFKFKPQQTETKINDINWQLGRTGRLTPVASIEPVSLAGSTISNVTLYNHANILEKSIGIGDEVIIQKAGDIIPEIVSVTKHYRSEGDINYPKLCPVCSELTKSDGVNLWCRNLNCEGQAVHRIHHYLKTIGVLNVGPANVQDMFEFGIISNISDLYHINEESLARLKGYGKKSANKIIKAINERRSVNLDAFLTSLGIHGLGNTAGKKIAKEYETLDNVLRQHAEDFIKIEDIGEVLSKNIEKGLIDSYELITKLRKEIKIKAYTKTSGNLSGYSFCITGTLSMKRSEMAEIIEAGGGEVKSSVSKGLDYLIAGEGVGKSKTDKAEKYGTKIISEKEFMEMR